MEREDDGGALTPGRSASDKLLLAIIDANPVEGSERLSNLRRRNLRQRRLQDARKALFGEGKEGRPVVSERHVLRWMGSQRYAELAKKSMVELGFEEKYGNIDEVSLRELAHRAAQKFYPGQSGVEERLRKKFAEQQDIWINAAIYYDDLDDLSDLHVLVKLQPLLERLGVRTNLDAIEDWTPGN